MITKYDKYVGQTINDQTIIKILEKRPHNSTYFELQCKCGRIRGASASQVIRGKVNSCVKCRNMKDHHGKWKGEGDLYSIYMNSINSVSRKRKGLKAEVAIDTKYLWELYNKQEGKCALSGLTLTLAKTPLLKANSNASVDRIDSSIGYLEGNVQWIHKIINKMKQSLEVEEFIDFCIIIANYQKNQIK